MFAHKQKKVFSSLDFDWFRQIYDMLLEEVLKGCLDWKRGLVRGWEQEEQGIDSTHTLKVCKKEMLRQYGMDCSCWKKYVRQTQGCTALRKGLCRQALMETLGAIK